jgi:hypothetical protein
MSLLYILIIEKISRQLINSVGHKTFKSKKWGVMEKKPEKEDFEDDFEDDFDYSSYLGCDDDATQEEIDQAWEDQMC